MARITYKEQGKFTAVDHPTGKTILDASLDNYLPHYYGCNRRLNPRFGRADTVIVAA